jgi:hypothetical protein
MSPETIFNLHLILGYVAWLLCFGVYILPRLKSMDLVAAQRAIATLHSFRFFGLVFILPGVVGPNLPAAGFAAFAAYWDLATGVLAILALSHGKDTSALLAVCRGLQSRGGGRSHPRLLPRHPGWPPCAGGAVGRHVRDPDHLRARAYDYARRRILFAAASSAQGRSGARQRCGGILDPIEVPINGPLGNNYSASELATIRELIGPVN